MLIKGLNLMKIKKTMIYKRLLTTYIVVIILLITVLDAYFINKVLTNTNENLLYMNERVEYDVTDGIRRISNSSGVIIENLFNDGYITRDIIDFLNTNRINYLKNKLDKFSNNKECFYKGIEYFTRQSFISNSNLQSIVFVSKSRLEISSFNRSNQISVTPIESFNTYNKRSPYDVSFEKNTINFTRKIRNPINYNTEGDIVLTYNLNYIKNIIEKYDNKHEIFILDKDGYIVYDSTNKYEYDKYPYFSIIKNSKELEKAEGKMCKVMETPDFITISKVPKATLSKLSVNFYNSLILMDIAVFMLGEIIVYIKFKRFNNRINNILSAMKSVEEGNFNIAIPVTNEKDEVNYIAYKFNEMCKQLNSYIEKSYLAEIEQKNAELNALQNQINPHFLYNTLESIRMKAICNGDKDVGKMLYTLAFLFRKQVKDKNILPIRAELDYCEKFIEIFKFRYEDKFKFSIECEEELLQKQIIKFTLQPLVENYFVHGIRLEDNDNVLMIGVKKEKENVVIRIKDNGRGIPEDKINELNSSLERRTYIGQSLGITNVHERLVLNYGDDYGIRLSNNDDKGVLITVKLPYREV